MLDFGNFLLLYQEAGLVAIFALLLIYDIFGSDRYKRWFRLVAIGLMALQTIFGFVVGFLPIFETGEAFGGMFISSKMTIFMKNILNLTALFVFMQASNWLRSGETKIREGEFYYLTISTLLGMYFMVSSGNFMMLFIGVEMATLPLACLVAYNKRNTKSAEAGAKYILMSALSAGIMMFGLSYLYGALGTMYFDDMAAAMTLTPMVVMGFVFFFAGLAFKISIVPFHLWTADVYEGAPTSVTAYLSVASKGAAVFALMFALYKVFGGIEVVWQNILWVLTVVTIIVGNLFAIRQKDIKRFLAFSSISQAGYILLGVMSGTPQGMSATVYYVLIYLFANLAAFGVISAIEDQTGRTDIAAYNGLRRTNPVLTFILMIAVFSLAGIPPLAGFFSKFFIFAAAVSEGFYVLVFIALVNTVISLYYYLLIIKAMFIKEPEENAIGAIQTDVFNKISLIVCSLATVGVGIASGIFKHIDLISFGVGM